MNCRDASELVHAYADDELDVFTARQVDEHLRECSRCRREMEVVRAVKAAVSSPAVYYKAPRELRDRVAMATRALANEETVPTNTLTPTLSRRERGQTPARGIWWGIGLAMAAAVLLALGTFAILSGPRQNPIVAQVLTAHLRSLQPAHLMDVVSTDQHTVKPWFDTHVDFSPPVRQLAPDFPLVGGRLDYLEERPVAALIYKRGQHIINVFVWPGEAGAGTFERRGFNLVHWTANGMTFWAVSDLNLQELNRFAQLFRDAGRPTTSRN